MIKRKFILKLLSSPICLQLVCMLAGGGISIIVSNTWDQSFYVEVPARDGQVESEENQVFLNAMAVGERIFEEAGENDVKTVSAFLEEGDRGIKKEESVKEGELSKRLNFAYYYDEGVSSEDVFQSYAGRAYEELLRRDASWMSGIYELRYVKPESMAVRLGKDKSLVTGTCHLNGIPVDGSENIRVIPSWNRFNVTFRDGDGTAVMGHSNIKEILSIANVYGYFNQEQSYDFLLSCTNKLWDSSHSYKDSCH